MTDRQKDTLTRRRLKIERLLGYITAVGMSMIVEQIILRYNKQQIEEATTEHIYGRQEFD